MKQKLYVQILSYLYVCVYICYILYYMIKLGPRSHGYAKWLSFLCNNTFINYY